MSHFAVVLRFYFTIHVEMGARVFGDIFLGLLNVLTEDVEHDGWGMEFDGWERLPEDA